MKTIEAEGGELVIKNTYGDVAIIPKNKRSQAQALLAAGKHRELDDLISELPYMEDYAEDGTLMPGKIKAQDGMTLAGNQESVSSFIPEEQEIDWNKVVTTKMGFNKEPEVEGTGLGVTTTANPQLYWNRVSGALSRYKQLKEAGNEEEAANLVFGHFDPSNIHNVYQYNEDYSSKEQSGRIRPIRAEDFGNIAPEYSKQIPDYEAIMEHLSPYKKEVADTRDNKIKAQDGMVLPDDNMSGLPKERTIKTEGLLSSAAKVVNKNKKQKETNILNGIYSAEDLENLRIRYGSDEMAKGSDVGCLGSTCRNFGTIYPNLPNYYKELEDAGAYINPIETSYSGLKGEAYEKAKKGGSVGIDSWELPYFLEEKGLGTSIFRYDPEKEFDTDLVAKYDYTKLPLGTILSFGNAKGVYTDPDAKSYRGKKEPLYRHSASVVGYTEGEDLEGNPVTDILIDDNGSLKRVGNSKDAEISWDTYTTKRGKFNLYAATSRKSTEKYTYDYLKSNQSEEDKKLIKDKESKKKFIEQARDFENKLVGGKVVKGSVEYTTGMNMLKTLDRIKSKEQK